jgi:hypothetical protein
VVAYSFGTEGRKFGMKGSEAHRIHPAAAGLSALVEKWIVDLLKPELNIGELTQFLERVGWRRC